MLREILLVGAGGFAGSICRYLAAVGVGRMHIAHPLPVATFAVNILGSLLIGILLAKYSNSAPYYLGVVGFCGGFTTFSAFSAEMLGLLRAGQYGWAAVYVGASVLVCILAVALGMYLGGKLK